MECGISIYSLEAIVLPDGYIGYLELPQTGQGCILTVAMLSDWDFDEFNNIRYAF